MEKILDRFLRYVAIDTESNPESKSFPSTNKQFALLELLVKELKALGVEDASVDKYGYVMATIPANTDDENIPAVGFIAHVDTSPDAPGAGVKPRILENYDGKDICLNEEKNIWTRVKDFPELLAHKGETIVTTDGTTLLGADDKAGVAEIMDAVQYIMNHPEFKHGVIKIGFTPDEEIGHGVDYFDVKKFGAKYAYTMDGGDIGELEYENFNAAGAKVSVQGRNVHPGSAKDKMINSILVATEFNDMLPVQQRPEFTENYEGFFHIHSFKGTVENTEIQYIIRDHDMDKYEEKKALIREVADFINAKYGEGTVKLDLNDQYFNMRKEVEPHYHIIEIAIKAMEEAGIKPKIKPIRGGTDGARLSYMGLPCPNIFAGGLNFHGKHELIPLTNLEKASEVILNIIRLYTEKKCC